MCFSFDLRTTDKRQKHTKIKCKRDESITVNIRGTYFFIEEAFESYWRSLADKNKQLPKFEQIFIWEAITTELIM